MNTLNYNASNVIEFIGNDGRGIWGTDSAPLADRVPSHDWASTPLGPLESWPESRRAVVDLVLASPLPMACLIGCDLVQVFNDAMAELPSAGPELTLGESATRSWPAHWPDFAALERARRGEKLEFGSVPRLERLSYAPLTPGAGEAGGVLVVAVPARARAALEDAELEHRARNTLSLLRSIVTRSAAVGIEVEDFAMHLQGRLEALARIQLAGAIGGYDGLDLATLVAEELQAASAHEDGQVKLEGPPVRVGFRAAEKLGLAIHELATNALKYGALAERAGAVTVRWRVDRAREPVLILEWVESGVNGPVARQRDGFGTELIERALPYELSATTVLALEADGARCTIRVPFAKLEPRV